MPFETLDQTPSLGGGKGFIERPGGVGVEIVLDEDDRLGFGEVNVGQIFQNVGVVDSGAGSVTLTSRQPSSGANIMNRLATPLRAYS